MNIDDKPMQHVWAAIDYEHIHPRLKILLQHAVKKFNEYLDEEDRT